MGVFTQESEEVLTDTLTIKPGDLIKMVPGGTHTNHDYGGCIVEVNKKIDPNKVEGFTLKGYQHGTNNWWTIGVDHWRFKKMTEWDY